MIYVRILSALAMSAVLSGASCATTEPRVPATRNSNCLTTTIDELWARPRSFEGRSVCVSGFLRRMVPYGEEVAEIFRTPDEAYESHSQQRVHIGIRMTIRDQARMATYSMQQVLVQGVFAFDPVCGPPAGRHTQETCLSDEPMALRNARVTFADGWQFP